ncbi:hypothetical protein [Nocardioides speluncae]|uniref:hypothetical protein n=1 Tax=Nocardioides speluncae TaxID=2670337 RepID=UPI001379A38B|nr:hypothetical protein [Nocardioides speluncae]
MTNSRRFLRLIVTAAASCLVAGATLLATPASADVPNGWSEPDPVNNFHALLVVGLIPLGLALLIAFFVYVPAFVKGERIAPGAVGAEDEWFGGPRQGAAELTAPSSDDAADTEVGGASGRW